ncbi:MAG: FAD-dependent oxidoreductase [Bacteroidota bacterium]
MQKNIVIIGNGISGITAARHLRKLSDHKITVISAETDHFYSRTALMYIFMGHMKYENTKPYEDFFWEKNRISLVRDFVEKVDPEKKTLHLKKDGTLNYDVLILAVGSKSNKFGWPGQDLDGVQGLYNYQDLENMERLAPRVKKAVIVGGGLIGIEMGEMWMSRGVDVSFMIREKEFWSNVLPNEEASMVSRHVVEHHATLLKETELDTIIDDGQGRVKGVKTKAGDVIDCDFVGLTVGVSPNTDFLKDSGIEMQRGIMVDPYFRTNQPDVYAIGDCAQYHEPVPGRRPIEQVWYTGRMHGETVAQTICGNESRYKPGLWFNSAKFMDIEYQVYHTCSIGLRPGTGS